MPKRSNDFQGLITKIYEIMLPTGATLTESKMILDDDSGSEREIDICIETSILGHYMMLMIECRDHSRKQSTEWIEQIITKSKALKANKVIAISHKGFYKPAIKLAKKHGIETYDLRDAIDNDWTKYNIKPSIALISNETFALQSISIFPINSSEPILDLDMQTMVSSNGNILGSIIEFINWFYNEYLIQEVDQKIGYEFNKMIKTLEDASKPMLIEVIKHMHDLSLHISEQELLKISSIKFVIIGNRKVTNVKMTHKLFNENMISFGEHYSETQNHEITVIQRPNIPDFKGKIKISRNKKPAS